MSRWQRVLFEFSHSRRILWRFPFAVLGLALAVGYLLHSRSTAPADSLEARVLRRVTTDEAMPDLIRSTPDLSPALLELLTSELAAGGVPFQAVLDFMPHFAEWARTLPAERINAVLAPHFSAEQAALAADVVSAVQGNDDGALDRLKARAGEGVPMRYAAHALGLVYFARDEFHAAYAQFRKEGRHADAGDSRRRAVECLVAAEDFDNLRALKSDPEYAPLIPASVELSMAIHERDWPAILRTVPRSQFLELHPAMTALSLVTGIAWMIFLIQLGQVSSETRTTWLLCAFAVAAGIVSTTPTIYAVVWQDDLLGFSPSGDPLHAIVYFIGAVGVREEVCKLALFLPFVPILVRRDNELEALIVASFVGLGFAIEENGNYFLASSGASMAGRFLTANFFHLALTGMNGLALVRAFRHGVAGLYEFLTVFGVTIIAHGLYDALPMAFDPALGGYLGMAVFVLSCQYYFRQAHQLREPVRASLSLTGAFVFGLTAVASATIIYQVARLGAGPGLSLALPEFVGTIILLVLFIREFDEPLTA